MLVHFIQTSNVMRHNSTYTGMVVLVGVAGAPKSSIGAVRQIDMGDSCGLFDLGYITIMKFLK